MLRINLRINSHQCNNIPASCSSLTHSMQRYMALANVQGWWNDQNTGSELGSISCLLQWWQVHCGEKHLQWHRNGSSAGIKWILTTCWATKSLRSIPQNTGRSSQAMLSENRYFSGTEMSNSVKAKADDLLSMESHHLHQQTIHKIRAAIVTLVYGAALVSTTKRRQYQVCHIWN